MKEWIKAYQLWVGTGLVGLILVGSGVWWWRVGELSQPKVEVLSASVATSEASGSGILVVDVAGAVAKPGVYKLDQGSRVLEAIEIAGGVTREADFEWLAKYLNQADKVKDGQKIYIPIKTQDSKLNIQSQVVPVENQKTNINSAGQGELEELYGIGEATAKKIIAGRPYARIEDLADKKIVSKKQWEQIRDFVSVW